MRVTTISKKVKVDKLPYRLYFHKDCELNREYRIFPFL